MSKTIPLFKVYMHDDAAARATEVLKSGYIGQGAEVEKFEKRLSNVLQNDLILTTNSATSAEHLAIHMLKTPYKSWPGINDGDEILATALTCTATNWPALANNLKIKWVDVDPDTLNMDMDDLQRKLSPTTKIIMAVHWGGMPADLEKLKSTQNIAKDLFGFKPAIIEDCAHAFGSTYNGTPIGNHGNICTFSFQAIKQLTCGDGGALVLPHLELYKRGKLLRWYGIDRESNRKDFRCEADIEEWGFKFHMNDINASIGLGNLDHIFDDVINKQKDNARYYNDTLNNVNGVNLVKALPNTDPSYWLYTIKVDNHAAFMRHMKQKNIIVSRVHERNDKHTCCVEFKRPLPTLDKIVQQMICIPVGWWVTNEDREYIVNCIKEGW